jgi:hypothetical protein
MRILSFGEDKAYGLFADEDVAVKASPAGAMMLDVDAAAAIPGSMLVAAYNAIVSPERRVNKFATKDTAVKRLEVALLEANLNVLVSDLKPEIKSISHGARGKFRTMMTDESDGHSMSELVEALGVSKKIVADYISAAKNPKYAGKAGILDIVKIEGKYHVRRVQA